MAPFCMSRPVRPHGRRRAGLRTRIPRDVLPKARGLTLAIPIGPEIISHRITAAAEHVAFSLRTNDKAEAKRRHSEASAYLESVWESLRNGPQRLTHKQVVALAGTVYRAFAETFEDEPVSPALWKRVIAWNRQAQRGEFGIGKFAIGEDAKIATALRERFGPMVDATLTRERLVVDDASYERLLVQVAIATTEAAQKLKRNAGGDYRPDPNASRFPEWTGAREPKPKAAGSVSLPALLEGWWKEAQATGQAGPSAYDAYDRATRYLAKFLGHDDASRITPDDVIRFKDHRLAEGASPKTVKDSDLAGLKSVLGWAVSNLRLASNPAAGITLKIGRKPRLRSKGFTDGEAMAILRAALAYTGSRQERAHTRAAKRWAPWLCAFTGARVGEILQLRKQDVRRERGHWIITITPEAGTVKTKEARDVPLHSQLVDMGFPEFVQGAPEGHLFLRPSKGGVLGALRTAKNRVSEFVRTVVPDKTVMPNHGWRHRFKTVGRDAGVSDWTLDAICGHAPRTEGESYGDLGLPARITAIGRLPRIETA